MSGILGILQLGDQRIDRDVLEKMADSLAHRGADGCSVEAPEHFLGLGHRWLDAGGPEGDGRPIASEDGRVWMTCDGTIFNQGELRQWLMNRGHTFRTEASTEVVLHLYEEEGPAGLERLNGSFSVAIWNGEHLFLARDPLGSRPLFFHHSGEHFAFASEPRAFLSLPGFRPEANPNAIRLYFHYRFIPSPQTALRGVNQLGPGQWLTADREGKVKQHRYWEVDRSAIEDLDDLTTARDLVREKLDEAVSLRLSDGCHAGASLSGGLDSSSVVALMSRWFERPVPTFALGFPESDLDERRFASAVAEKLGCDHTACAFTVKQAAAIIPELLDKIDEPFGDAAIIANLAVARLAAQRVKVVLSGDGGDEMFAGFGHYFRALHPLAIAPPLRPLFPLLRKLLTPPRDPSRWSYPDTPLVDKLFFRTFVRTTHKQRHSLYGPLMKEAAQQPLEDPILEVFDRARGLPPLPRLMAIDLHSTMGEYHLIKVDRAASLAGLEVRAPYLDPGFVALAFRFSPAIRLHGNLSKGLLREAMRDTLPRSVIERGKQGFGPPIKHWLNNELATLARERLQDTPTIEAGLLSRPGLESLLRPGRTGKVNGPLIWRVLVLEAWFRNIVQRNGH